MLLKIPTSPAPEPQKEADWPSSSSQSGAPHCAPRRRKLVEVEPNIVAHRGAGQSQQACLHSNHFHPSQKKQAVQSLRKMMIDDEEAGSRRERRNSQHSTSMRGSSSAASSPSADRAPSEATGMRSLRPPPSASAWAPGRTPALPGRPLRRELRVGDRHPASSSCGPQKHPEAQQKALWSQPVRASPSS